MFDKELANYIQNKFGEKELIKNPACYIYDLKTITDNINNLKKYAPSQLKLYYAMKANNNKEIMRHICNSDFVSGVEIASSGELDRALKYYNNSSIIFTGPGKTDYELECAIKNKIRLINIESVVEAVRINNIARKLNIDNINVLIRINLNYSITEAFEHMSGCSTKMGIDEDEYFNSYEYINKLDRVTVKGIHVFAASGVLDYESLIKSEEYIFNLVKRIEKNSNKIDIIDLGGGLGIDYSNDNKLFDTKKYFNSLSKLIEKYKFNDKEIIMELGTYIVGSAGYYAAKIIDIKEIKGHKHIVIAGGVNHMGLPLEMRRKHPVVIIPMHEELIYDEQPNINKEICDISGPLCMVTDKLSWDEYIDNANIGDIVVYRQAGAYCYGEGMHDFLSHMYPKEFVIK